MTAMANEMNLWQYNEEKIWRRLPAEGKAVVASNALLW